MCILNNPRRFALLLTPCARAAWSEVGGLVLAPAGDTVLLQVCVCVCVCVCVSGKYTGCPNYSGGPGTACKIFQGSPELLSKLFRVL